MDSARERLRTAATAGAIDEAASALLESLIRQEAVPTAGGFAWAMSESYAEQYALENWGPSWSPIAGEAVHLMNIGVQLAQGHEPGVLAGVTLHTSKRLIEAGHSAFMFYEEYNAAKNT